MQSPKSKKRKIIRSESRAIIASMFHFLKDEYKFMKENNHDNCDLSPLANVAKRTAEAAGVGGRTVAKILKEERELASTSGKFVTPLKTRRKRDSKLSIDHLKTAVIRSKIQNYHIEHTGPPSLSTLKVILGKEIGFDGCISTLRSLLIKLGYKWQKISSNRPVLQERHALRFRRFTYIKKMREYRAQGRPIVYADETHVHISPDRIDIWSLKNKDAPLPKTSGKESSFIIVHAGSKDGGIPNASLVYEASSTTEDDHSNMSFDNYSKWLEEELFPNLPEKAVIVMDNAPYNTRCGKIPTSNSNKNELRTWLMDNKIKFDENCKRIELYDLFLKNKEHFLKFKIDDMIRRNGFEILRLPPLHPELNAIEHIRVLLKKEIEAKTKGRNSIEIPKVIKKGLENIDREEWSNACNEVEKMEEEYMSYFDYDSEFVIEEGESSEDESEGFVESDSSDSEFIE